MQRISKSIPYLVLALLFVFSVAGNAQTITGGVNGTVTDVSGAVLAGARVTATNASTNVASATTTNRAGVYSIRFLQIGQYNVTIEAPGFRTRKLGPFDLEAGQDAKFDAQMGLEGSNTTVSVSANLVPLLNTENATIGTTLDTTAINSIPLNGRNFASLTEFVPGAVVTQPGNLTGSAALERASNSAEASQNGNRQEQNNFLLDGVDINETLNNASVTTPAPML